MELEGIVFVAGSGGRVRWAAEGGELVARRW